MPRVQEYIVRSGRYHLSAKRYDNIRSALVEMRTRVCVALLDIKDGEIKSDNQTFVSIEKNGREMRRFTLVNRRGEKEGIPFGHLLKVNADHVRSATIEKVT